MIKALIFDLDDTLFDSSKLAEDARREAIKAINELESSINIDEDECYEVLLDVITEFGSNYSYHFDQLIKRINGISKIYSYGIEDFIAGKEMIPPPKMLVQAAVIAYHNVKFTDIKPFDDVIPFLRQARNKYKDIKISVLTDGLPEKQYEKILRLKIHPYLDDITISDEVGVRKPNTKLYSLGLGRLGELKPEESIYIGDHYSTDIVPSKNIGINSVLIHRGGKYDRKVTGKIKPDFEIDNLFELFNIIDKLNDI
ncbi:MAG: TIGR02253 family HAD-type hydrolase [Candidatus Lokiarchaeota archaeon]|nr:TIGR02253 family HAD-type hydrolase [Candidatus Lokiarchaeota archaeon]